MTDCVRCGTDPEDRDGPHTGLDANDRCCVCADWVAEFGGEDE